MRMVKLEYDENKFQIRSFFEYSNNDLRAKADELIHNPEELKRFIGDVFSATACLEKLNIVHGDIRSEFIFYYQPAVELCCC